MQDKNEKPKFEPAWVNAVEVFTAGLGHRKPSSVAGDMDTAGAGAEEISKLVAVFEALEPTSGGTPSSDIARNVVARLAKESKEATHSLTIEDSEGETTTVSLSGGAVTIGRSPGNTVCLDDRNVSREHCEIHIDGDKVEIEDLSRYGTRHNGQPIQGRMPLKRGDVVQIGDFRVRMNVLRRPADSPKAEAAAAASTDIPVEQAARLVVVSSNFYGTEYPLTREQNIIGRVDADITIDHRSISSWHAKVVRDGASYKIVDLGSSNGVIINGEQYRTSALKHNDLLDLGHVKLQFVGAGLEFKFEPSAATGAAPVEGGRGGMGLLLAAAAILLVGVIGGGIALLMWPGKGGEGPDGPVAAAGSPATAGVGQAAEGEEDPQVADFMKRGEEAMQAEEWGKAIFNFDFVLEKQPNHPEARSKKSIASREKPFKDFYVDGKRAFEDKRYDEALSHFDKISSVSSYDKRVNDEGLRERARSGIVGKHLSDARMAMDRRQWREARGALREALALDSGNAEVRNLQEEVDRRDKKGAKEEAAVAARSDRGPSGPAVVGERPASVASAAPPAEEGGGEDKKARREELLKSARQKNIQGDLGGAQADASESLKYGGGAAAYFILAQIAEKQGDTGSAVKNYNLWLKGSCGSKLAGAVRDKIIAMGGTPSC